MVNSLGAHPCSACCGIYREDALTGVEEISGVAGYLEGREGAALHMTGDLRQQLLCGIAEHQVIARCVGVTRTQLFEHGYHHVVGGFVYERYHHLLTVDLVGTVLVLFRCGFRDLPHEIPRQHIRQGIAQLFHHILVDVAGFCGAHEGYGSVMPAKLTFLPVFRYQLIECGGSELQLAAAEPVPFVLHELVELHHRI